VIDEPVTHLGCHEAVKRLAIVGHSRGVGEQLQVDLVDERGGLQRVSRTLATQISPREALQFTVGLRDELLAGFGAAGLPSLEQCGDVTRFHKPL
jgi:hypothetical protein